MKIGYRKPSLKKSIKAKTTSKWKRSAKRAVIPGYGKKGSGWIKDPKKAAYNKVYNKTTKSVNPISTTNKVKKNNHSPSNKNNVKSVNQSKMKTPVNKLTYSILALFFGTFGIHRFYAGKSDGITYLLFCWTAIPTVISLFQGVSALLTSADIKGNIYI